MRTTTGWKSIGGDPVLARVDFERRDLRADDIAVRIDYCGICHSDLHRIHGLLGESDLIPGHEFVGTVTAVGTTAARFGVGDVVAVGTIVDSCGDCPMCRIGQENFCWEWPTTTYGGKDRIDGTPTMGGYSREYVLRESFAHRLPGSLDPAAAAPLLCAGITVWEPMVARGVGPGTTVAVAGLGGLGHLAVRLAAACGADVTVLSRSRDKQADALALGAQDLLVPGDAADVESARGRFDLIIDTISADHEFAPLLRMLAMDGELCVVGNPLLTGPRLSDLGIGRKKISSSGVGGLRHTAELLAFCADHGIVADVEVVPSSDVNAALDRLGRGDVRYRFVLDLADLDDPIA